MQGLPCHKGIFVPNLVARNEDDASFCFCGRLAKYDADRLENKIDFAWSGTCGDKQEALNLKVASSPSPRRFCMLLCSSRPLSRPISKHLTTHTHQPPTSGEWKMNNEFIFCYQNFSISSLRNSGIFSQPQDFLRVAPVCKLQVPQN